MKDVERGNSRKLHFTVEDVAMVVDCDAREVWLDDEHISLTRTEFDLLLELCTRPHQVVSQRQLLEKLWGSQWFDDARVVQIHMCRLRAKLGDICRGAITTVRGVGYRFDGEPRREADGPKLRAFVEISLDDSLRITRVMPEDTIVAGWTAAMLMGSPMPVSAEWKLDSRATGRLLLQGMADASDAAWHAMDHFHSPTGEPVCFEIYLYVDRSMSGSLRGATALIREMYFAQPDAS